MSDQHEKQFLPDDVTTPGEGIRHVLARKGWSIRDLASEMDSYPLEEIERMAHDDRFIKIPDALDLEDALGMPAETWMRLETSRQLSDSRKTRSGGAPAWESTLESFDRAGREPGGTDPAHRIHIFLQDLAIYRFRRLAPLSYIILDTDEALSSDDPEVAKWKDKAGARTVKEFREFASLIRALSK